MVSSSGEAAGGSVEVSIDLAPEAGVLTFADAWGAGDGTSGRWARAGAARAIATAAQKIRQLPGCASGVGLFMAYFVVFGAEAGYGSDGSLTLRLYDGLYSNPHVKD